MPLRTLLIVLALSLVLWALIVGATIAIIHR